MKEWHGVGQAWAWFCFILVLWFFCFFKDRSWERAQTILDILELSVLNLIWPWTQKSQPPKYQCYKCVPPFPGSSWDCSEEWGASGTHLRRYLSTEEPCGCGVLNGHFEPSASPLKARVKQSHPCRFMLKCAESEASAHVLSQSLAPWVVLVLESNLSLHLKATVTLGSSSSSLLLRYN